MRQKRKAKAAAMNQEWLYQYLSFLLDKAKKPFADRVKVTLVIRNLDRKDADVILGDDTNYDDVIALLSEYRDKPATFGGDLIQ